MVHSFKIKNVIDYVLAIGLIATGMIGLILHFYYGSLYFIAFISISFLYLAVLILDKKTRKVYWKVLNLTFSSLLLIISFLNILLFSSLDVFIIIIISILSLTLVISNIVELLVFKNIYPVKGDIRIIHILSIIFLSLSLFLLTSAMCVLFSSIYYYEAMPDSFGGFISEVFNLFIIPSGAFFLILGFITSIIGKKEFKKGLSCSLAIALNCLIISLPQFVSCKSMVKEYSYFTIEKWDSAEYPQKKYLYRNFLKRYEIIGWTKDNIESYLGSPDKEELESDNFNYLYKLNGYKDRNIAQVEYGVIVFSLENIVIKTNGIRIVYE